MDDLEIAWRPLGELIPYARNPRTHSDAQVAQIAASIREFGWTNPVLVDGANGMIAGPRPGAGGAQARSGSRAGDRARAYERAQKRAYVCDNQLA